MNNFVAAILSPFIIIAAKNILHTLAQTVWDALWVRLLDAIKSVELQFKNNSELKKEQVLTAIMLYVAENKKLSKVQTRIIRTFIGFVIDKIIEDLNKNNGHSWATVVLNLKQYWAGRIPYVD